MLAVYDVEGMCLILSPQILQIDQMLFFQKKKQHKFFFSFKMVSICRIRTLICLSFFPSKGGKHAIICLFLFLLEEKGSMTQPFLSSCLFVTLAQFSLILHKKIHSTKSSLFSFSIFEEI